jgi:hypothetical protein
MPLNAKGQKILAAMIEQYGEEEGTRIFYASKNAGTITGVDNWSEAAREAAKAARKHGYHATPAERRKWEARNRANARKRGTFVGGHRAPHGWAKGHLEAYGHGGKYHARGEDHMPIELLGRPVADLRYYDPITGSQNPGNYGRNKKKTLRDPMGRLIATEEEDSMPALFRVIGDAAPIMVGPTSVALADKIEFDDKAKVHITKDGYLAANPRVAKVGVQLYAGAECGIADMDVVRVYRPEATVFATDALKSFPHKPVTLDHPPVPVTSDNWKEFAVGHIGDEVLREGDAIRVPMTLMDKAAIAAFQAGTNQLSVGYTCDLEWSPGITPNGETYDAIQRNIRANHLAVVAVARGGPTLKIGDDNHHPKENVMNLKTVMVDGIECQMTDTAAALVARTISGLHDQIENLKKEKKKGDDDCKDSVAKITELTTALGAKDVEITTLKKQLGDSKLTPAQLDQMVKDRHAVFDKARKIMGDKLVVDGKSVEDVRREVVNAKMGDTAKGWTDEHVKISFDTLTATSSNGSNINDAVRAFAGRPGPGYGYVGPTFDASQPQQLRDAAYALSVFDMETAWMNPEQRKAAAIARGIQL